MEAPGEDSLVFHATCPLMRAWVLSAERASTSPCPKVRCEEQASRSTTVAAGAKQFFIDLSFLHRRKSRASSIVSSIHESRKADWRNQAVTLKISVAGSTSASDLSSSYTLGNAWCHPAEPSIASVFSVARFWDARVIGKKVALARVPLMVAASSSTEISNQERANGKRGIYCEVSVNVAMG